MALIHRETLLQQLQAPAVKERQLLCCHLPRRWQSGLEQMARTAAALERGGYQLQAAQPLQSRPASQQLKRAQRRRAGCSLPQW
jgi:hypothetical protein